MQNEDQKHNAAPRASAGGVVVNSEGKIALVQQHGNSWSFPKGGIEAGESELEAARREVFEETGLRDLELLQKELLGSYERYSLGLDGKTENPDWGLRKRTLFLFGAHETDFRAEAHDEEITDMRWVTFDEALELLTHPKDREFLASVRERIEAASGGGVSRERVE